MFNRFLEAILFIVIIVCFFLGANLAHAGISGPPQLISPGEGETDVPVTVTLKWKGGIDSAGTYWYEVNVLLYNEAKGQYEVDKSSNFSAIIVDPNEEVEKLISGLSPDRDRWWWVQVCEDNQKYCDNWSGKWQFHTQELTSGPGNGGNGGSPGGSIGLINPLAAETLEEAINAFINFLFYLAMATAPILIVYAGFLLLTAGGDPVKISRAKQIITWTLVAVAVILFAKGLPALIKGAFGG